MKNYPIVMRKKESIKSLIEICMEILQEDDKIKDYEFNNFLSTFFSFILYKKNLKSCFLYSICISKSMMKDLCKVSY